MTVMTWDSSSSRGPATEMASGLVQFPDMRLCLCSLIALVPASYNLRQQDNFLKPPFTNKGTPSTTHIQAVSLALAAASPTNHLREIFCHHYLAEDKVPIVTACFCPWSPTDLKSTQLLFLSGSFLVHGHVYLIVQIFIYVCIHSI